MKRTSIIFAVLVLASLVVGLSLYVLLREPTTYIHHLVRSAGIQINTGDLPDWLGSIDRHPLIYSLPSALWSYSLVGTVLLIWGGTRSKASLLWIGMAIGLGLVVEFAQFTSWLPGTFDIVDLVFILVGALAATGMYWLLFESQSAFRVSTSTW